MRLHRTLTVAWILGSIALAAAPAAASHADPRRGVALAMDLNVATSRLHDSADRHLRYRGGYGNEVAGTLHRMDEWATYYRKAVQREGFRSDKARQRFQRFLVEYRSACGFLDRGRDPDVAVLHATVAELSDAYGRRDDRWHDRASRHRDRRW